jgi:hypothetical protein
MIATRHAAANSKHAGRLPYPPNALPWDGQRHPGVAFTALFSEKPLTINGF